MRMETISADGQQSRLDRILWALRNGLPFPGRAKRYLATVLPSLGLIWVLVAIYLIVAPTSYASRTIFILPGSGVGSSLNLESIGQASTATSSAFSSPSLSPTENYKRLLMSDVVIDRAEEIAGAEDGSFPRPTVRLVDQTNLVQFSMTADTPERARERSLALRQAFLLELSELRADEAERREEADRTRLDELEGKVREAQQALLRFQGETGLVSMEQFNGRIASFDALREREREARTSARRSQAITGRLASSLQISRADARRAMLLRADPEFQLLLDRYANLTTQRAEISGTLGDQHPDMEELAAETDSLRDALGRRGQTLTGLNGAQIMQFADLAVSDIRAGLMQSTLAADGEAAGASAALAEIRAQLQEQSASSPRLVEQASELADLTRDLRVAEAVFSSALAQLDTNQADPFASYPLVQTLEEPTLPRKPSSPNLLFVLGGGLLATFLTLIGFLLLWSRQRIIRKILPSD